MKEAELDLNRFDFMKRQNKNAVKEKDVKISEHLNVHTPAFIIKMGKDAFKDGLSPQENPYRKGNISNYLYWQEGWDIACKKDMEDAVEASENIVKEWDWLESEAAEADEARDRAKRAKKFKLEMACPDCKHTLYLTIEGE